jgi:3-oxoacyl-[acyl-carrier protein] reductase
MHTGWNFTDKVVLVTGSSQGIGAVALREFVRHGATGVLNYFPDPAGANRANADAVAADIRRLVARPDPLLLAGASVTDPDALARMMDDVKAGCGRLDVLVNNAGILRDRTLAKMTPDEWNAVIDTNLTGVFRAVKAALPVLADGGRIISIASVAGQVGFFGQTNYAAAKAGIVGFTKSLARELAKRRITVNAVAPGLVKTAMAEQIPPEARAGLAAQIPLGRLAEPEEVVNAILFLASDDSAYITGQTLNVNGGWYG